MPLPLAITGNVNVDLVLGPVAPWPKAGSEIIVDHNELRIGGSAANSALALSALGCDFQLAASAGDDLYGAWLREGLLPYSRVWPDTPGPSTLSVGITHPSGERTFLTTRGHLEQLAWSEVEAMIDWSALRGGWLLLCGAFLTPALTSDYDLLFAQARAWDIRVALDIGWPPDGWTETNLAQARHWISRSDCLLVNEIEAASLTGKVEPEEALDALLAGLGPDAIAVVKCGANGACAAQSDGPIQRAPAPEVEVVDTIGAGDVFNAALLYMLSHGKELGEALSFGVRTASRAIATNPRRYTD